MTAASHRIASPLVSHAISRRSAFIATSASVLTLMGTLAACSPKASSSAESQQDYETDPHAPRVLATFTVIADIARNVSGPHMDIRSITKPGAEIHDYEPTPDDIKSAQNASLIIKAGLGLERWFDKFTNHSKATVVDLSEGIDPIMISGGEYNGQPNPHAWMSPINVVHYVDLLVTAFSTAAPEHADDFAKRGADYQEQLRGVMESMTQELNKLPENERALVTCEGAFSYLAKDAGLAEGYLWPVNSDNEGTPQQIASTITFVDDNHVPAVFCESTVNDKAMKQVAQSTGADFAGVLYVDSLTGPDGDAPTYLDLITYDATTITNGLSGKNGQ
ncbi:metal ABC transporter substrate-binding protein [Actinomyces vulturis]|uniref:metal ABC transporter substrate-binding protein n=1 Tax=Actinomyces vulturis TaxID=1857645 RepID=UPI0009F26F2A|nr:metal ABC transporter substrate-binding protein [Actinomyces vulturis]